MLDLFSLLYQPPERLWWTESAAHTQQQRGWLIGLLSDRIAANTFCAIPLDWPTVGRSVLKNGLISDNFTFDGW